MKYLTLFGSRGEGAGECVGKAVEDLCQQLRVYNDEGYAIEGV